jgi:hypothetical protein
MPTSRSERVNLTVEVHGESDLLLVTLLLDRGRGEPGRAEAADWRFKGIWAFALLAIKTRAVNLPITETAKCRPEILTGGRGTAASSLFGALDKKNDWVTGLFGSIAKAKKCIRSSGRTSFQVNLKPETLSARQVKVLWDGKDVSDDRERLDRLVALSNRRWQEQQEDEASSATSPPPSEGPDWPRSYDFSSFLELKRRHFTARMWLIGEIDAWRRTGDEWAMLIVGDPGIGKSALVAELAAGPSAGRVLAYHFCRADTPTTQQAAPFVSGIAAMIAGQLPGYAEKLRSPAVRAVLNPDACAADPGRAFESGVLGPLGQLQPPPEGAYLLLIDGLDEAAQPGGPAASSLVELVASRREFFPPWLRLVATTKKIQAILDRMGGAYVRPLDAGGSDNLDDLEQYVRRRLAESSLRERVTASGRSAEWCAGEVLDKAAGNFLYAKQALDGVASGQYPVENLHTLPPGLPGMYEGFFRRHFPDDAGYARARPVLQAVMAAREPLTEDLLGRAAGLNPEDEFPDVLRRLGPYLPEQQGRDGTRRRTVFHQSLADWLTADRQASYYASRRRGHERLADACWAEFRQTRRPLSAYALAHLPAHLAAAERWGELAEVLCDHLFLEAKVEAGWLSDLIGDFTLAASGIPTSHPRRSALLVLGNALRIDSRFLARHPSCLFQCLRNRIWWCTCDEATGHYQSVHGGGAGFPFRERPDLAPLLERWRRFKEATSGFYWLRSLRPPSPQTGELLPETVLRGHAGTINDVAFSPDGTRLASGSCDWSVRVWDARNAEELLHLRGHAGKVNAVAFSPDGARLASASDDKTVRVWDARQAAESLCLAGHGELVNAVAFSPDGARLASASDDKTVRVWDARTGAVLHCLRGHESPVNRVVFSPDGERLASASWDRTVRVWDARNGAELLCLRGHQGMVGALAFSPDGERLASASWDRTVRVWDALQAAEPLCLTEHEGLVDGVAFSNDGRRLASRSEDKTVRVWDALEGTCLEVIQGCADVLTVAGGGDWFPWRAVVRGQETVIESAAGNEPVAWLPLALDYLGTHPSGRTWAGAVGNDLWLFTLEEPAADRLLEHAGRIG